MLKKWEELLDFMKCDEVWDYYNILSKRKMSLALKRAFDLVVATILLIILAIPMAIIAVLIKKDSKGTVFYRQERITAYGKKFKIHKFRTMVNNADKIGTEITVGRDSRITKVGEKLRDKRLEGKVIIRQTTESLENKGFCKVSPIYFFAGCNLIPDNLITIAA